MLKDVAFSRSGTSKYPKYETTRLEFLAYVDGGDLARRRAKLGMNSGNGLLNGTYYFRQGHVARWV